MTPTPTILVVSRRKGGTRAPEGAVSVYVGRAIPRLSIPGSPLGNPFRVPRGYDITADPDDVLGGTGGGSAPNGSDERAVGGDRLVEWCERSGDTLALECLAA